DHSNSITFRIQDARDLASGIVAQSRPGQGGALNDPLLINVWLLFAVAENIPKTIPLRKSSQTNISMRRAKLVLFRHLPFSLPQMPSGEEIDVGRKLDDDH
ncbi:MAG: hypothetical protein ACKOB4_16350, partial [Acidobacteriota bacterium]